MNELPIKINRKGHKGKGAKDAEMLSALCGKKNRVKKPLKKGLLQQMSV